MIGVLLILLSVFHKRGPLQLMLLAWIGLITYITYGRASYLFIFLWYHVPMFSSLRVWSRMNIILVPILAWMLALAYSHFESLLFGKTTEEVATERRGFQHWPLVILTVTYAAALGAQLYLWIGRRYDVYWTLYYAGAILPPGMGPALPNYLRRLGVETHLTPEVLVAYAERAAIVCGVVAFAALMGLLLSKRLLRNGGSRLRHAVMAAVLTLAVTDLWMVGPWAWSVHHLSSLEAGAGGRGCPQRGIVRQPQSRWAGALTECDVLRRDHGELVFQAVRRFPHPRE